MAGGALGELVRKMGDRVVKQIVPILQVPVRACACMHVCARVRGLDGAWGRLLWAVSHTYF